MEKELVWNVYYYNVNTKKIEPYNIFQHGSFSKYLYMLKTKYLKKNCFRFDTFMEEVKKELKYYFWCKSECETILTSWPPYINEKELMRLNEERKEEKEKSLSLYKQDVNLCVAERIDVYDQVVMNWDAFKIYMFNNYKLIKKVEE